MTLHMRTSSTVLSLLLCVAGLTGCGGAGNSPGASGNAGGAGAGAGGATGTGGSVDTGGAGGSSSGGATGSGGASSGGATGSGGSGGSSGVGLSAKYPGDKGIGSDPAVIFHSGFENGLSDWSWYTKDTSLLDVKNDPTTAHGGSHYLRASVTQTQLAANPYISAHAQYQFPSRVPVAYWRFYARFVGNSAVPHHWVRVGAGNATYASDGLAAVVPAGDQGFWFDLDAHTNGSFSFYVYWQQMRSWECNDGTTNPSCAGYNGPSQTPYYGNNFNPAGQSPFPRDKWFCVEIMTKANTPNKYDGELAFWINNKLVGDYKTGTPAQGRWLRDNFYTHGQYYQDVQAFEGFGFRTVPDVGVKRVTLDAYYQKDTLDNMIKSGIQVPEAEVTLYDDVVVATQRIGCEVPP